MKLKFNGTVLAERFFDPAFGSPTCQFQRRQPFGTKGILELRGQQGGQPVMIRAHLKAGSYAALKDMITACYSAVGTNGELELEYAKSAKKFNGTDSIGKATLDSVEEVKPRSRFVFDTDIKGGGWHVILQFNFLTLEPPSAAKAGFGR